MVGDEDGSVNVYQLKKMNATPENQVTHMKIKFFGGTSFEKNMYDKPHQLGHAPHTH